jgi:hypothetical protein
MNKNKISGEEKEIWKGRERNLQFKVMGRFLSIYQV